MERGRGDATHTGLRSGVWQKGGGRRGGGSGRSGGGGRASRDAVLWDPRDKVGRRRTKGTERIGQGGESRGTPRATREGAMNKGKTLGLINRPSARGASGLNPRGGTSQRMLMPRRAEEASSRSRLPVEDVFLGSWSNTFQNRIVSSPAADTTVFPSGERAVYRTRDS